MTDQRETQIDHERVSGRAYLGSAALFAGAALILLAFVDKSFGLPFNMPRSWYTNRMLWYVFALGSVAIGWRLLRQRVYLTDSWKPSRPGPRFETVRLYSRENCHLCDHAMDVLNKYRPHLPKVDEIDIDSDPHLVEQFGDCVPVVEFDGKIRFRGRVDETLLRRLIEGTPAQQMSELPNATDANEDSAEPANEDLDAR